MNTTTMPIVLLAGEILVTWWVISGLRRAWPTARSRTLLILATIAKASGLWILVEMGIAVVFLVGTPHLTPTHATPLTVADARQVLSKAMNGCNPTFESLCAYIDNNNVVPAYIGMPSLLGPDLFARVTTSRSHIDANTHERVEDPATSEIVPVGAMGRVALRYDLNSHNDNRGPVEPFEHCVAGKPCNDLLLSVAVPLFSTDVQVTQLLPYAGDANVRLAKWTATFTPTAEGRRVAGVMGGDAQDAIRKYAGTTKWGWTELRYVDDTQHRGWYSIAEYDPHAGRLHDQAPSFIETLGLVGQGIALFFALIAYMAVQLLGGLFGGGGDSGGGSNINATPLTGIGMKGD